MNAVLRIGLGIVIVVSLVLIGLAAGWVLWGRGLWTGWGYGMGPGMMGRWDESTAPCTAGAGWGCGGNPGGYGETSSSSALTIEDAHEAVERYIDSQGYSGLEIAEVMEFEHNFYAIVEETDTGIGAMELLVDKWTGEVSPEMGPNMMWNTKYGMHGRGGMMGRTSGTDTLTPDEALDIAQRWLDANRPGVTVEEHADPFYGYYTIHTLKDGEIEGMLSVHGSTGQVWYHTWHGAFVNMIEEAEHD
jgi:hypothetical protein